MRRFSLYFSLISFVSLTSLSTFAADLPSNPVEPVVAMPASFVWTGFYVGAEAGYAWGNSTYKVNINPFTASLDPKGAFGGAFAGFNYQLPSNVVLGLEGDFNGGDISSSGVVGSNPAAPGRFGAKEDWFGSARARLGYSLDRFMPYVTGGVAIADYKHDVVSAVRPGASWSDTYVGWTAGAGLEYAITDNIIARIEYRYSDYGKQSFPFTPVLGAQGYYAHSVDLKTNDVRVGISYKF